MKFLSDQRKCGNEPSMTHRWIFYEISMIFRRGSLVLQTGCANSRLKKVIFVHLGKEGSIESQKTMDS